MFVLVFVNGSFFKHQVFFIRNNINRLDDIVFFNKILSNDLDSSISVVPANSFRYFSVNFKLLFIENDKDKVKTR